MFQVFQYKSFWHDYKSIIHVLFVNFRRYIKNQVHHILVSPFYSLSEVFDLRKLGIHVIPYSDNTTSKALSNILKIIKPKNIMDCNESNPKPDLLMNHLLISRTNLSLESFYLINAQRLSLGSNVSPNLITLVPDVPENIAHLYTDTQESFVPLATSSQVASKDDENANYIKPI